MKIAYIVVLVNGKHFTDEQNAAHLLNAIERGDRVTEVVLDLQGDGLTIRGVKLITQNLVMLIPCPENCMELEFQALTSGKIRKLHH